MLQASVAIRGLVLRFIDRPWAPSSLSTRNYPCSPRLDFLFMGTEVVDRYPGPYPASDVKLPS